MSWINILNCISKSAVSTDILFVSFFRVNTFLDSIHNFAKVNKLVTDNFVIFIKTHFQDITFSK